MPGTDDKIYYKARNYLYILYWLETSVSFDVVETGKK